MVRQANMLTALLDNWDQVTKAQDIAANSAGTASDRYTIYMQSIEAATNEFKAAWQEMWSKTISDDSIKDVINFGTKILELVDKMGGLIPVVKALAAAIIVLNWSSITKSMSSSLSVIGNIIPAFQALIGRILFATGITNSFAAAETAMTASTALATGGLSLLVAGVVLLISNADKLKKSLDNTASAMQESFNTISDSSSKTDELISKYEELAKKTDKTQEDYLSLSEIQKTVVDQYGNLVSGVNLYNDAVQGNTDKIDANVKKLKELSNAQKQQWLDVNKSAYNEAQSVLNKTNNVGITGGINNTSMVGTQEMNQQEFLAYYAKQASLEKDINGQWHEAYNTLKDQLDLAKQIADEYNEIKLSIQGVDAADKEGTAKVQERYDELQKEGEAATITAAQMDSLSSSMDALSTAEKEQADNGEISNQTAVALVASNAELAQFLDQTTTGYKLNTQAAMDYINAQISAQLTSLGLKDALALVTAGHFADAIAAIADSDATQEAKDSAIALIKSYVALSASMTSSVSSSKASTSATNARKDAYEAEIKSINKSKDALNDQIDALKDQKEAYDNIIEAKKNSLKLDKEKTDYESGLKEKNKELADIDNELLELQFDNSEEAAAKRLKLEDEKASKVTEIAEYQADRTYDVTVDALDAEQKAYDAWIDAQIAGIESVIDSYDALIDKINEMIDALSKASSAASGTGISTAVVPTTKKTTTTTTTVKTTDTTIRGQEINANKDLNGNGIIGYASGGSFETNGEGLIRVHPNEIGAVLNKSQISAAAPLASFFSSIMKNTGTPQISTNNIGGGGVSIGDIQISVAGNLDKTVLPDLKEMIMKTIVDATKNRGIVRNAASF